MSFAHSLTLFLYRHLLVTLIFDERPNERMYNSKRWGTKTTVFHFSPKYPHTQRMRNGDSRNEFEFKKSGKSNADTPNGIVIRRKSNTNNNFIEWILYLKSDCTMGLCLSKRKSTASRSGRGSKSESENKSESESELERERAQQLQIQTKHFQTPLCVWCCITCSM